MKNFAVHINLTCFCPVIPHIFQLPVVNITVVYYFHAWLNMKQADFKFEAKHQRLKGQCTVHLLCDADIIKLSQSSIATFFLFHSLQTIGNILEVCQNW